MSVVSVTNIRYGSCICSKMSKLGFPCIQLEIGLGHILCIISFLDIDMIAILSIVIWNLIGVYMRSGIPSKMVCFLACNGKSRSHTICIYI